MYGGNMKKAIHIAVIIVLIVAIFFTGLMVILRYNEKGETNMPFDITKISIISKADGENIDDNKNLWNKKISQNNDIYIYIEKNENYSKTETINNVLLNNFQILETPQVGNIFFLKPSTSENANFENKDEFKTDNIVFEGKQSSDIQSLEISNQGGIVAFRCANENLGNYISNDKEIDNTKFLKGLNLNYEQIKAKISFDLEITLEEGRKYKTTIELEIPNQDVIEKGTSGRDLTDLDIVFKRIEN